MRRWTATNPARGTRRRVRLPWATRIESACTPAPLRCLWDARLSGRRWRQREDRNDHTMHASSCPLRIVEWRDRVARGGRVVLDVTCPDDATPGATSIAFEAPRHRTHRKPRNGLTRRREPLRLT